MTNQEAVEFVYDKLKHECSHHVEQNLPIFLPKIADDLIQYCITDCLAHDNLSVIIILLQPLSVFC